MAEKLKYPGLEKLDSLISLSSKFKNGDTAPTVEDKQNYWPLFFETIKIGLPTSSASQILKTHIHITTATLEKFRDKVLPIEFTEYLAQKWQEANILDLVWLLDKEYIFEAYAIEDKLLSRICIEHKKTELEKCLKHVDILVKESPIPPELMMYFYVLYGQNVDKAKVYEYAKKLLSFSTDTEILLYSRSILYDREILFSYHYSHSEQKNVRKLSELKKLDFSLTQEFGSDYYIYGSTSNAASVASGVITMLSKKAKAEKNAMREYQDQLLSRVYSVRGGSSYVQAYSTYLIGKILAATGDLKSAIKRFKQAIEDGFAPRDPLVYLGMIYLHRNKPLEVKEILDKWLPIFDFSIQSYKDRNDNLIELYFDSGGSLNSIPNPENDDIINKIKENERKIDFYLQEIKKKKEIKNNKFWESCFSSFFIKLDLFLKPADYNLLLNQKNDQVREIQIPPNIAISNHLDELNAIEEKDKDILINACYNLVPSDYVAKISAKYILNENSKWENLITEYKNLGSSTYLGLSIFNSTFTSAKIDVSKSVLLNFMQRNIFTENTSKSLFGKLKEYYMSNNQIENKLKLEEEFIKLFSASEQTQIKESFTETILELVENSGKMLEKIRLLERGLAMDSNNEKIQKLLKQQKNKKNKIILITAGSIIGIGLIIYILNSLFNFF